MRLSAGAHLGPYQILGLLGAGGMGEVYRARDARLARDVAMKVLPAELTGDSDRISRLMREAQVLASLDHPHIAQIYGIEEAGDLRALVMECIEGQTLAERIAAGRLPLEDAIGIAGQIADALQAAHDRGVVHRDLKPANIKLRPDGNVKVLDFGLARVFDPDTTGVGVTTSPTLTAATRYGVLLGTAAYMSPEQAKGAVADRRSDVWALGCIVFEMLTGRRAFAGDDVSETLAEVLKGQPDWDALPATVPRGIRDVIAACLTRDRKARIPDASAVGFLLRHETGRTPADAPPPQRRESKWRMAAALAAAALAGGAIFAALLPAIRAPRTPTPAAKFVIPLPADQVLGRFYRSIAISPDGQLIAYAANRRLYLRRLGDLDARPIAGTAIDANLPFFSPDGQWIGFYVPAERKLKKVPVTGGAAVTLCDAAVPYGVHWSHDDRILFSNPQTGILRVPANGGSVDVVARSLPGEWLAGPNMLPDGEHVLFAATKMAGAARWDQAQIVVQSIKTGARKVLLEGGADPRYLGTGHLLYALGSTLLAVRFDAQSVATVGAPIPVLEGVWHTLGLGLAHVDVAENGTLVFIPGSSENAVPLTLALAARDGTKIALPLPAARYSQPRVSPDGHQIAVLKRDEQGVDSVWIGDIAGTALQRLTFEAVTSPLWSRDGRRVIFGATRGGAGAVYWQPVDRSAPEERLTPAQPKDIYYPNSVTPDGSRLAFYRNTNGGDIWTVPFGHDESPSPLISQPPHEDHGAYSPDGRWIAYRSDEPGQYEVFVQPIPPTGRRYQITTTGGMSPLWAPNGRELFYVTETEGGQARLAAVDVQTEPAFRFSQPAILPITVNGAGGGVRPYDVTPDGARFLVTVAVGGATDHPPELRIVLNWVSELRDRVR